MVNPEPNTVAHLEVNVLPVGGLVAPVEAVAIADVLTPVRDVGQVRRADLRRGLRRHLRGPRVGREHEGSQPQDCRCHSDRPHAGNDYPSAVAYAVERATGSRSCPMVPNFESHLQLPSMRWNGHYPVAGR